MKKLLSLLLTCVLLTSLLSFTGCFAGGGEDKKDDEPAAKTASVNIDINPSIELIVGEDEKVVAVRGVNDDGVLLTYGEDGIVGADLKAAIEKITSLAIEYGYLNDANSVVGTIVNASDEDFFAAINQAVNSTVTATAEKSGLTVTTDASGAFSLLRQMEEMKAANPNDQILQAVTVSKFRLALSVSETGEMSLEAALKLDDSKLLEMLKEADKKMEEYATEQFNLRKSQALALYDKVVTIKTYAAYAEVYGKRLTAIAVDKLDKITTAYYGAAYQLYASAKTGFAAITSAYDVVNEIKNYPLTDAQITAILAAFGMEDDSALRDENGKVTVKSVEAYADKYFKNAADGKVEEVKTAVKEALSQIEETLKAEIDKLSQSYKAQIEAQIAQAEAVFTAVKPVLESVKTVLDQFGALIPAASEISADINKIITDYEDLTARVKEYLEGEEITVTDLDKLVGEYSVIAAEYLEKISADLTEEEKALIESKIADIEAACKEEKAALEKSIDDAAKAAKEAIEAAKAALKGKLAQ